MNPKLSHINQKGQATMVNIGQKPITDRIAIACGHITMQKDVADLLWAGNLAKGEAISTARIAGIMAAKRCADLIPLCHPLGLDQVLVNFLQDKTGIYIEAMARCHGKTGIEMEALTAVSVAALTLYDMAKAVDKNMTIGSTQLIYKQGGKSGVWQHSKLQSQLFGQITK